MTSRGEDSSSLAYALWGGNVHGNGSTEAETCGFRKKGMGCWNVFGAVHRFEMGIVRRAVTFWVRCGEDGAR